MVSGKDDNLVACHIEETKNVKLVRASCTKKMPAPTINFLMAGQIEAVIGTPLRQGILLHA